MTISQAIQQWLVVVPTSTTTKDVETILEFSPVRDSPSNGIAEKAVQTIEGLSHTYLGIGSKAWPTTTTGHGLVWVDGGKL